jgi:hypothetical protein
MLVLNIYKRTTVYINRFTRAVKFATIYSVIMRMHVIFQIKKFPYKYRSVISKG